MICPHCGTNIPQGHTVCPFCKAQAVRRAAPTQQKSEPTVSSLAEKSLQRKSRQQQKKKQQRRRALLFAVLLVLCIALVFGTSALIRHLSSNSVEAELRWQEQYDLGSRYLSEGNYEAAVLAFRAAIDIDPKRPEPYLGAAEAYVALGDREAAEDILAECEENTGEDLSEKLEEIIKEQEEAQAQENTLQVPERKLVRIVQAEQFGDVAETTSESFLSYNEDNLLASIREVYPSGHQTAYEYFYDTEGRYISTSVNGSHRNVYTYDEEGRLIHWTERVLDEDWEYTYHYDSQGSLVSAECIRPGFSPETITYRCDEERRIIEERRDTNTTTYTYNAQNRLSSKTIVSDDEQIPVSTCIYDYESFRPFTAELYDGECFALLFQDTVGHTVYSALESIYYSGYGGEPLIFECDDEGYVTSVQFGPMSFTFYYDDAAPVEEPAIGVYQMAGNDSYNTLQIHSVAANTITFSVNWYRAASITNATATLSGNKADFLWEGSSGTLTFEDGGFVTLDLTHSNLMYIEAGTYSYQYSGSAEEEQASYNRDVLLMNDSLRGWICLWGNDAGAYFKFNPDGSYTCWQVYTYVDGTQSTEKFTGSYEVGADEILFDGNAYELVAYTTGVTYMSLTAKGTYSVDFSGEYYCEESPIIQRFYAEG